MATTRDRATERQFPCRNCGAELMYDPAAQALTCAYCGFINPVPRPEAEVGEQDFERTVRELSADAARADTVTVETLKCESCGAEVDLPAHATALSCPFCDSPIVATARSARRIKPAGVLPFKVPRGDARRAFRTWLRKLWFAPGEIKHAARSSHRFRGMYVPYWTYDSSTVSRYHGLRGDNYVVVVGSGKNRRTEVRVMWTPVSGTVYVDFDDVLVMASHSLPRTMAQRLEPWDLHHVVPYADEFLSGFGSESYQIDLARGFDLARAVMEPRIHSEIRRDIGGDTQQIHAVDTRHHDVTWKHLLLPVWVSAYRYRDKVYRFLVNARTGEVQGERPWSWIKIALAVLVGGVVIAAGVLLSQQ